MRFELSSIKIKWLAFGLVLNGAVFAEANGNSSFALLSPAKVYGVDIVATTNTGCRTFVRIGLENNSPLALHLIEGRLALSLNHGKQESLIGHIVIEDLLVPVTADGSLFKAKVEFIPVGDHTPRQVLDLIRMFVGNESSSAVICLGMGDCVIALGGKARMKFPYSFEVPIRSLDSLAKPGDVLMKIKGERDD